MNWPEDWEDPEADRRALGAGLVAIGCALGVGFLAGVAVIVVASRVAGWWN